MCVDGDSSGQDCYCRDESWHNAALVLDKKQTSEASETASSGHDDSDGSAEEEEHPEELDWPAAVVLPLPRDPIHQRAVRSPDYFRTQYLSNLGIWAQSQSKSFAALGTTPGSPRRRRAGGASQPASAASSPASSRERTRRAHSETPPRRRLVPPPPLSSPPCQAERAEGADDDGAEALGFEADVLLPCGAPPSPTGSHFSHEGTGKRPESVDGGTDTVSDASESSRTAAAQEDETAAAAPSASAGTGPELSLSEPLLAPAAGSGAAPSLPPAKPPRRDVRRNYLSNLGIGGGGGGGGGGASSAAGVRAANSRALPATSVLHAPVAERLKDPQEQELTFDDLVKVIGSLVGAGKGWGQKTPSSGKEGGAAAGDGGSGAAAGGKRHVRFSDTVAAVYIPVHTEYSGRVRRSYWSSAGEIRDMVYRNMLEYDAEGYDWRQVAEEEDMYYCEDTGEWIHPVFFDAAAEEVAQQEQLQLQEQQQLKQQQQRQLAGSFSDQSGETAAGAGDVQLEEHLEIVNESRKGLSVLRKSDGILA